jgi:iron complex transport system ATP-binding protein
VTVRELVSLGRLPHRGALSASSPADEAAIDSALSATDTGHLATRTIHSLSGGECARAKMARVLAGNPDWIIADEPLANLDPPHQRDMLALFRTAAAMGKGVIVILHQLNAAMRAADDVVLLKDGRIVAHGPKADVLTPEHLHETFDMAFDLTSHGEQQVVIPRV